MSNEIKISEDLIKNFTDLLTKQGRNREFLSKLKATCVDLAEFKLASEIGAFEKANFKETPLEESETEDKEKAYNISQAMRMVDVKADPAICYKFMKLYDQYQEIGGKFSIQDAAKIVANTNKLYGES